MAALPSVSPRWRWPRGSVRRSTSSKAAIRSRNSSARTRARYLVTVKRSFLDQFYDEIYPYAGLFAPWIGTTGGDALKLGEARAIPVADLKSAHEGWFPNYMAGEIAA